MVDAAELLAIADESAFIAAAYEALFSRQVDAQGYVDHRFLARSGYTRVELIEQLAKSAEGQAKQVVLVNLPRGARTGLLGRLRRFAATVPRRLIWRLLDRPAEVAEQMFHLAAPEKYWKLMYQTAGSLMDRQQELESLIHSWRREMSGLTAANQAGNSGGAHLKPQVVILGAGPQAREVIDVIEQAGTHGIAGVVAGEAPEGGALYGYPYLGKDGVLPELAGRGIGHAFVAIGDNRVRLELMRRLKEMGFELPNAISPHAYVSPHARLGSGVVVMHGAVVSVGAEIGDGVILNHSSVVGHDVRLGRGVHIAAALIGARAEIGEGTNVWPRATVTLGVKVGTWATIGAGSLVMRDVPDSTTVVGLPGKWLATAAEGE